MAVLKYSRTLCSSVIYDTAVARRHAYIVGLKSSTGPSIPKHIRAPVHLDRDAHLSEKSSPIHKDAQLVTTLLQNTTELKGTGHKYYRVAKYHVALH